METNRIAIISPSTVESLEKLRRFFVSVLEQLIGNYPASKLRRREIIKNLLKHVESDPRLHIIGSIQTIEAVGSHHTVLFSDHLAILNVDDRTIKTVDNLSDLSDQNVGILEFVLFTLLMKVEELIADILFCVFVD